MWEFTLFSTLLIVYGARGCFYPGEVRRNGSEPWVGKIRNQADPTGGLLVYFRDNRMSLFVHKSVNPGEKSVAVATYNRTCVEAMSPTKFLVTHEERGKRPKYLCMEIVLRSKAVFQLRVSDLSIHIDPLLCYTAKLKLDPWLFVSYELLKDEHQVCSFTGGFNMKIWSSEGSEYGCNSMELPMRLESECIGGEGMQFQFRYETCKKNLPMDVDQQSFCVANWIDSTYTYSVLRKINHDDLWCLRSPLIRTHNFTSTLFLEGMCGADNTSSSNFVSVNLESTQYEDLCEDEYKGCSEKRCTTYTEQSCQKSCELCHAGEHMSTCRFPKPYRGEWLQKNYASQKIIKIQSSKMSIQNVGTFKCVHAEKGTEGVERKYAMVSKFSNGCRPRFSCVAFRRFGHNVLSYTLSQSITWPFPPRTNVAETVCEDSQFSTDPPPIRDTFRGSLNTFKTIVLNTRTKNLISCQLRQAHRIRGSFNGSDSCEGQIFEDCNNNAHLRMRLRDCGAQPSVVDFQCLAVYEGRYWERITIIQNMDDPYDTRCLVFSEVRKGEMMIMAASECDKQSWLWASGGERTALGKFQFELEQFSCKLIPVRLTTTPKPVEEVTYRLLASSGSGMKPTNPAKPEEGERPRSKTVTRLATPSSESLAKDSNLQSDSRNVAVVEAPDTERGTNFGVSSRHSQGLHMLTMSFISAVCVIVVLR